MKRIEFLIAIGLLLAWLGFGIYLAGQLSTVRPNVERIVLDLNHVSK